MEYLRAYAHLLGKTLKCNGRQHKLLDVEAAVGVFAAVDDVKHRLGQGRHCVTGYVSEMHIERHAFFFGTGAGKRHRHAKQSVGAEPRFVFESRRAQLKKHRVALV